MNGLELARNVDINKKATKPDPDKERRAREHREIQQWNADVDRRKAEKREKKGLKGHTGLISISKNKRPTTA